MLCFCKVLSKAVKIILKVHLSFIPLSTIPRCLILKQDMYERKYNVFQYRFIILVEIIFMNNIETMCINIYISRKAE